MEDHRSFFLVFVFSNVCFSHVLFMKEESRRFKKNRQNEGKGKYKEKWRKDSRISSLSVIFRFFDFRKLPLSFAALGLADYLLYTFT